MLVEYLNVYMCCALLYRVIAWGLSLERPTMIKYKIENIRDLFGHKADLAKQRTAPIARF
jgi:phenylalanyl-tRNA synthetase alpha chain